MSDVHPKSPDQNERDDGRSPRGGKNKWTVGHQADILSKSVKSHSMNFSTKAKFWGSDSKHDDSVYSCMVATAQVISKF